MTYFFFALLTVECVIFYRYLHNGMRITFCITVMWNRYCIVFGSDKGAIQMELNEFQENLPFTEKFSQVPSKLHHNQCLKTFLNEDQNPVMTKQCRIYRPANFWSCHLSNKLHSEQVHILTDSWLHTGLNNNQYHQLISKIRYCST